MCLFFLPSRRRLEEAVAKQEKEWQSLLVELEHEISVTVGLLGTLCTRASHLMWPDVKPPAAQSSLPLNALATPGHACR